MASKHEFDGSDLGDLRETTPENIREFAVFASDPKYWKKPIEERIRMLARAYTPMGGIPDSKEYMRAQDEVAQEERQRKLTVAMLKLAPYLFVSHGDFVSPSTQRILTPPEHYIHYGASVDQLFHFLEVPEERLQEVYEYGKLEGGLTETGFTGRFASGGKQNLADILQQRIEFHSLSSNQPIVSKRAIERYEPRLR